MINQKNIITTELTNKNNLNQKKKDELIIVNEIKKEKQNTIQELSNSEHKLKKELYDIISNHSGQAYKKVEKDSDRDYWMTSDEAKEYGMVDEVLGR